MREYMLAGAPYEKIDVEFPYHICEDDNPEKKLACKKIRVEHVRKRASKERSMRMLKI